MTEKVSEKTRALELAMAEIEKQYGRGSVMRLGDESARVKIDIIPTGSLALDSALGVGGMPRGRVVEIFGPESSGKTTLALHIIANAQKGGGSAAFIDAEHALDPSYAAALGVDTANLLIAQPDTGEQALDIAETLVRSGAIDVVVVDSVAALVPKVEIEGDMGDQQVGLQARLMSRALRKLTGTVSKSNTCFIFINQIRMKIGQAWGGPEIPRHRARGYPAGRRLEGRQRDDRQPDAGESRKEQGRSPVPRSRVRYSLRQRHLQPRRSGRYWRGDRRSQAKRHVV